MKKIDVKSVLIGILLSVIVLLLGSWKMGANSEGYSITCNSEGNVVYVASDTQVMISKDFGQNWEEIHQFRNNY